MRVVLLCAITGSWKEEEALRGSAAGGFFFFFFFFGCTGTINKKKHPFCFFFPFSGRRVTRFFFFFFFYYYHYYLRTRGAGASFRALATQISSTRSSVGRGGKGALFLATIAVELLLLRRQKRTVTGLGSTGRKDRKTEGCFEFVSDKTKTGAGGTLSVCDAFLCSFLFAPAKRTPFGAA